MFGSFLPMILNLENECFFSEVLGNAGQDSSQLKQVEAVVGCSNTASTALH